MREFAESCGGKIGIPNWAILTNKYCACPLVYCVVWYKGGPLRGWGS